MKFITHLIHICNKLLGPSLIIYLYKSVDKFQENIKMRRRYYEQNISDICLINIEEQHLEILKQQNEKILFININYVSNENYKRGVSKILF